MTFFVFVLAGLVIYGLALMRLQRVTKSTPGSPLSVDVGEELLAGRPIRPATRAALGQLFEPSEDPVIERARRATLLSFAIFIVLGACAFFVSPRIDRVIRDAAALSPIAAAIPVMGLLIALDWLARLPASIVGPDRNLPLAFAALGGIGAGVIVVGATPLFLS